MILEDDSIQDSTSVVAMLRTALEFYKKGNPEITEIFIRSDNAGMNRFWHMHFSSKYF